MAMLLFLALTLTLAVGVGAQDGGPAVAITRLDDQAFPRVTAYVTVSNKEGWPLPDLTGADFWATEDGVAVPAESIAVESDTPQGLRLALALDVSMNASSLTRIKEAARSFINTLGPSDQVMVIAFYDEARLVQDFTNDKKALEQAIDSLTIAGNLTAFNKAALESVTRVGALPTGRKAVVMLTNSANNAGAPSSDEIVDKARSVNTPIYVIGFGKAKPDVLEAMITATGGELFILPNLDKIEKSFQTIGALLGQGGYKVTWQSSLKADNAEHSLLLGVTYQGKKAQAEGRFVAVPGKVTVTLPGLAEGQEVGGVITLAVQATAPAPIAAVEYQLNGRPLTEVTTPPYTFKWDSTAQQPGSYRLTARVVDKAGNEGQVEVNLYVAQPLAMTVYTDQTEVELGKQVVITAEVKSLAKVARVDFLVDGNPVGSKDTPPYRLSLDSGAYPPGEHRVTVRASDTLGWEAEAVLNMQFLAPPAPQAKSLWRGLIERLGLSGRYRLLVIGGGAVTALGLVAIFFTGLAIIARNQKRRRQKTYRLEIANLGNVPSRYELRAEEPIGALKFQFALHGVNLPQTAGVYEGAATKAPTGPPPTPKAAALTTNAVKGDGQSFREEVEGGGVQQTATQAMSTGNAIADLVDSIGRLLPGSLGESVRRAVLPAYQAQSRAYTTTSVVKGKVSQAQRVSSQVSQAKPAASPARSAPEPARAQSAPVTKQQATRNTQYVARGPQWAETPPVEPGETLAVDLLIDPLKPYQAQDYSFKVLSKAVGQEGVPPVIESGSVQVKGVSWFRHLLPYLIFTVVMITIVVLAVALVLSLMGGDILLP
jgi:VWFA-related protein